MSPNARHERIVDVTIRVTFRKGVGNLVLERNIEQYLIKTIKLHGGIAIKLLSATQAGLPDRLVLMPSGKIWFVELKRSGEDPSDLQIWRHGQLKRLGHEVLVFDNKNDIDEWLEGLKGGKD